MTNDQPLHIVLHAPTPGSLQRARSNAANLARATHPPLVRILVNAEGVAAALDQPDPVADALTLVCPNTLKKIGRTAAAPLTVLEEGSILAIARMQREGWCYVRA